MVALPEIDILDVGMGGKMLSVFYVFYASVLENDHIFFRKIAGKYTTFKEKCWKNFCNNPGCTICENEEQLFCKKTLLKYFAKFK